MTSKERIFYDVNVPSSAKLLYAYIKEKKSILSTNEQLAVQFNVTSVSISNWLSKLEETKYIQLNYKKKERLIELA